MAFRVAPAAPQSLPPDRNPEDLPGFTLFRLFPIYSPRELSKMHHLTDVDLLLRNGCLQMGVSHWSLFKWQVRILTSCTWFPTLPLQTKPHASSIGICPLPKKCSSHPLLGRKWVPCWLRKWPTGPSPPPPRKSKSGRGL